MDNQTEDQHPTVSTDARSGQRLRARFSPSGAARLPVLLAAGFAVLAAVVVVILVTRPDDHRATSTSSSAGCGPLGCTATVNVVRRSPRVTVFFGRACSGLHGSWYLNAVQGGQGVVRAEYYLRWSFPPGSSGSAEARPGGRVVVAGGPRNDIKMSVAQGALKVSGTGTGGAKVSGTGTLVARLTGTTGAPTLTLTESGLTGAERALGLLSPFVVDGRSLNLAVTESGNRKDC